MYTLRPERAEDWWAVEALYDLCFAPGREALSSYRLRDGVAPVLGLSTIAVDDLGILAGAIRFWPVQIGSAKALLLGPIAVHPTRQGEGLGGALMHDTCDRAFDLGWERVLLVGDAPYYSRFGFEKLYGVDMPPPTNPERILGRGDWHRVSGEVRRAGP
ncbi:MAG: N-acetyltransferase [Marinovum sp.]|nr:N-acetyltransferase [Marinovum sp.]